MQTAAYLCNRAPNASWADETPYKALYGTDANLGHLRAIGARAFVHVDAHTSKLERRAWEGRLVGYNMDSKSFGFTMHRQGVYARAGTSSSSRHLRSCLSQTR